MSITVSKQGRFKAPIIRVCIYYKIQFQKMTSFIYSLAVIYNKRCIYDVCRCPLLFVVVVGALRWSLRFISLLVCILWCFLPSSTSLISSTFVGLVVSCCFCAFSFSIFALTLPRACFNVAAIFFVMSSTVSFGLRTLTASQQV